uniref:XK-related protein n=1 Tax=Scleropages formosus TaxID=113540 RepID=A0A8C9QZJ0_SCLFO
MAAKSDGVLKMKRSDVAFTPLQNSDHSGSAHGLAPGSAAGDAGDCCGSSSTCLRVRVHRERRTYTAWDCLWALAAVAVYCADVGTDVWLSVDYYLRRDYWWFGLTLLFAALGSLSVQLFSFRWFAHDFSTADSGAAGAAGAASRGDADERDGGSRERRGGRSASRAFCVWLAQSLVHALQLAQVWRYFHTIYLGVQSRRGPEHERWRFYWRMVYEYADVSMLHLLATFLESAPQLVLQLCIIIQTHKLQAIQGTASAASLVSLAWAMASYQKALRDSRDDKRPMGYLAVLIQFCWHFFTIAARVITFALFASVFQLYFGVFIVLHWCIMTFWIVHCETEFCVTKWEEIVFDMVVGIIYIFSWFNVKEGRTRCRLFAYYLVVLAENAALSALWYLYRQPMTTDAFAVPALCVVFSSFLTGVVFMLMYYAFFHPNGPRFGRSLSCALDDPSATFILPPEGATNSLRSNRGASAADRDPRHSERDGGCPPVFQVRPTAPSTPSSRAPRVEEPIIRIDLCRNRYPAWEQHVLDRNIRRAVLAFESSAVPPRLQYKDDALVQERLEYETTL